MITTRDIKVFIFSILFSTLCYALFDQPIKEAEAQGGPPGPPMGAPGMAPPGGDPCAHVIPGVSKHPCYARLAHDEIKEKLDTLLAR